jgi:hypothetical protein
MLHLQNNWYPDQPFTLSCVMCKFGHLWYGKCLRWSRIGILRRTLWGVPDCPFWTCIVTLVAVQLPRVALTWLVTRIQDSHSWSCNHVPVLQIGCVGNVIDDDVGPLVNRDKIDIAMAIIRRTFEEWKDIDQVTIKVYMRRWIQISERPTNAYLYNKGLFSTKLRIRNSN